MGDTRIGGGPELPSTIPVENAETDSDISSVKSNPTLPEKPQEGGEQVAKTAVAFKGRAAETIGQNRMNEMFLRQGLNKQFDSGKPDFMITRAGDPEKPSAPAKQFLTMDEAMKLASGPITTFNTPTPPTGGPQKSPNTGAPTAGAPVTFQDRNREQAIRGMQTSLNRFRAANQQPAINVSGQIDQQTTDAIRDFQKTSGLPETGVMNESTRDRLTLLSEIKNRISNNKNSSGPNGNLNMILGSDAFRGMPEKMQTELLKHVKSYAVGGTLQRDKIGTLADIVNQSEFRNLSSDSKKVVLDDFYANPQRSSLALITNAVGDPGFSTLSPALQKEALESLHTHPDDSTQTGNVMQLLNDSAFQKVNPDVRKQVLEGLPYRFDGVQLDAPKIANIVKLVNDPGFAKLRPEVASELMNALARRPDNAALAAELQQLAASPRFQQDRRTWLDAIEKAEKRIP